jgi:hypothetical protein
MAHFAQIKNNIVQQVIVADTQEWCESVLGGEWVQTSYNTYGGVHKEGGTPLRKNYAGVGYTYDRERDAFIPPQQYPSWTLNEETCLWNSPIPYPEDGKLYSWDEENVVWVEQNI